MPRESRRRRRMSRICAWIVTSSAVVGSSAISNSGSHDNAIAIITRCFCPPDIWWGYLSIDCSGLGMPTSSNSSIVRCRASAFDIPWCSRRASIT
jgi:hypothetical protein